MTSIRPCKRLETGSPSLPSLRESGYTDQAENPDWGRLLRSESTFVFARLRTSTAAALSSGREAGGQPGQAVPDANVQPETRTVAVNVPKHAKTSR